MPKAIIKKVESIVERENVALEGEDWTVVPGGVAQQDNWGSRTAGVGCNSGGATTSGNGD